MSLYHNGANSEKAKPGIEMDLIKCFHCDEPGHWVSECPLLTPPAGKAEHDARFQRVMDRFWNEGLDPHVKQRIIAKENELWKQVQARAA